MEYPSEVMWLNLMAYAKIPVGMSTYDRIISKYPEYFPKEYERKTRWESIPNYVHEARSREFWEFYEELYKGEPGYSGLASMLNNTKEYQEWEAANKRLLPIIKAKEDELEKKYYSKYLDKK